MLGGDTAEQDTLVVGVGDLLDSESSPLPDTANGKLLVVNDSGEASPFATGLNNPFALGTDGKNTVWVADNAPGDNPERLLRLTAARSEKVASWTDTRVPSGLAVLDDRTLAICYYATGELVLVDADNPQGGSGPLVADDCRFGVQSLGDRRLKMNFFTAHGAGHDLHRSVFWCAPLPNIDARHAASPRGKQRSVPAEQSLIGKLG